jgi:tetratricopeptide (TPR) repeat protein
MNRDLDVAEREFFHGSPQASVPLFRAAADAHSRARWLLGAALGALGRYGDARDVLSGALRGPYASLAASTLASHYRQLGRHDEAPRWDERAMELAGGDADALFDARLGLAADAVGAGDLPLARARLDAVLGAAPRAVTRRVASQAEAGQPRAARTWRERVRVGWVETEVALLAGDPSTAVRAARAGLAVAERAGAPRHIAKCLLFLGVSQRVVESMAERVSPQSAEQTLTRAADVAREAGATPLTWVIEHMLAQCGGDPAVVRRHRLAAAEAVQAIGAGLPDTDKSAWFVRLDIAEIVAI